MAEGNWILGDVKDGMPAMIRYPITNGYKRFSLFRYEEANELRDYLNALERKNAIAVEALEEVVAAIDKLVTEGTVGVDGQGRVTFWSSAFLCDSLRELFEIRSKAALAELEGPA